MQRKSWPYVAGILDAEGTIVIGETNGGFYSKIKISNTNKKLMKWLVQNFGNVFYKNLNSRSNRSVLYEWNCLANQQEAFLLGVLPFLLVKKPQALTLLEFRRTESLEEKKKLCDRIKQQNQRLIENKTSFINSHNKDRFKYAAGYMDGDGGFYFGDSSHTRIYLTSIDFIIIKWFLANFGGKFYKYNSSNENHSDYFRWVLSGRKNKKLFLLGTIPYMILKREQAKNLLQIIDSSSVQTTNTREISSSEIKKES